MNKDCALPALFQDVQLIPSIPKLPDGIELGVDKSERVELTCSVAQLLYEQVAVGKNLWHSWIASEADRGNFCWWLFNHLNLKIQNQKFILKFRQKNWKTKLTDGSLGFGRSSQLALGIPNLRIEKAVESAWIWVLISKLPSVFVLAKLSVTKPAIGITREPLLNPSVYWTRLKLSPLTCN